MQDLYHPPYEEPELLDHKTRNPLKRESLLLNFLNPMPKLEALNPKA